MEFIGSSLMEKTKKKKNIRANNSYERLPYMANGAKSSLD
jgi:hypothetical protein